MICTVCCNLECFSIGANIIEECLIIEYRYCLLTVEEEPTLRDITSSFLGLSKREVVLGCLIYRNILGEDEVGNAGCSRLFWVI